MPTKTNVLIVMSDQQSARAMSASGSPHVDTPHMDALAASGLRFDRCYCTTPVCGPARASLFYGRMPDALGTRYNQDPPPGDVPHMGHVFREAGHQTRHFGAWDLPAPRENRLGDGFDFVRLPPGVPQRLGDETDGVVLEQACQFLKSPQAKAGPWLAAVAFLNPHDICWWVREKPVPHANLHALPPLPPHFEIAPDEPEFVQISRRRQHYGPEIQWTLDWSSDQWRAYLYAYYRLTEQVDRCVGRLLAALHEEGHAERTLVVFTCDHGEGMAAHRWVAKLMFWEEVMNVPLILSCPGQVPRGAIDRTHLVSSLDLLPTVCDYAGIAAPPGTGRSLRPIVQTPPSPWRDSLVCELATDRNDPTLRGRMVRTDRHKWMAFSRGARPEMLFDMDADPGETRNLASETAMKGVRADLRDRLVRWMAGTGDDFTLPQ